MWFKDGSQTITHFIWKIKTEETMIQIGGQSGDLRNWVICFFISLNFLQQIITGIGYLSSQS